MLTEWALYFLSFFHTKKCQDAVPQTNCVTLSYLSTCLRGSFSESEHFLERRQQPSAFISPLLFYILSFFPGAFTLVKKTGDGVCLLVYVCFLLLFLCRADMYFALAKATYKYGQPQFSRKLTNSHNAHTYTYRERQNKHEKYKYAFCVDIYLHYHTRW